MANLNLSASDVKQLQQIAQDKESQYHQHAQALLLTEQGLNADEAAAATSLSRRQVLYWIRQFQQHGLARFADSNEGTGKPSGSPHKPSAPSKRPGLNADDSMVAAGRKLMRLHYAKMLVEETPVRENRDIEAVHDMRVATRRLRSTLELFEDYFRRREIKPYHKRFRDIAQALGAVRDLEVMQSHITDDLNKLEDGLHEQLRPLLNTYQQEVDSARAKLLGVLDSPHYADLVSDFAAFLEKPDDELARDGNAATVQRICYVVPGLAWEAYARCRVYAESMAAPSLDTLHQLRIDTKRFRYLLEGFEEVLGPEVSEVINAAKALQDHLGLLQDARVAIERNLDFVRHTQQEQPELSSAGVLRYVALRSEEQEALLAGVPEQWARFTSPALRRALALALSAL